MVPGQIVFVSVFYQGEVTFLFFTRVGDQLLLIAKAVRDRRLPVN